MGFKSTLQFTNLVHQYYLPTFQFLLSMALSETQFRAYKSFFILFFSISFYFSFTFWFICCLISITFYCLSWHIWIVVCNATPSVYVCDVSTYVSIHLYVGWDVLCCRSVGVSVGRLWMFSILKYFVFMLINHFKSCCFDLLCCFRFGDTFSHVCKDMAQSTEQI